MSRKEACHTLQGRSGRAYRLRGSGVVAREKGRSVSVGLELVVLPNAYVPFCEVARDGIIGSLAAASPKVPLAILRLCHRLGKFDEKSQRLARFLALARAILARLLQRAIVHAHGARRDPARYRNRLSRRHLVDEEHEHRVGHETDCGELVDQPLLY